VLNFLRQFFRDRSVDYLVDELRLREEIFGLLVLSPLLGYPLVTSDLSLRLLPYLSEELQILIDRIQRLEDQFGETLGRFDLG